MNACQKRIEELLAEPPATEKKAPERDAHGRFAAGNSGGPGNPFGRYTAMLREAMVSVVTEEDMQAIVRKMIDMARVGSIPAMRLVLQYVIGKPTAAANPDRVDVDEWNVHKETAAMTDDVSKVVKSLEPEACLEMAREIRPVMSEVAMEKYAKEFEGRSGLPERTLDSESTLPPHGFDGGESNAPHPLPLSPEYRGEGGTAAAGGFDGRSVLPERTFVKPGDTADNIANVDDIAAQSDVPRDFDGGESNTPHPQPLSPEYRGEGGTVPQGFDGKSVLPERTLDRESTLPPNGFDGGVSNAPHPLPLSPEYRGEGGMAAAGGFDGACPQRLEYSR